MLKTVICKICKNKYKLITQLHLRTKHDINLDNYLKIYPYAKIRPDYKCEICDVLVTHRKSSRAKYCNECSIMVNKDNVLLNVRKYNLTKKRYLESQFTAASKEYGLMIDKGVEFGSTRIDKTHTAWDFVPHKGQKILGTVSERDLKPDKDGNIPALIRLKKQMRKKSKNV